MAQSAVEPVQDTDNEVDAQPVITVTIVIDPVGRDPRFFAESTVGDFLQDIGLHPDDVIVTVDGHEVEPMFVLSEQDLLEINILDFDAEEEYEQVS